MTLLHTVASLNPDAGGPSRTVSATCAALGRRGETVAIVTSDHGGREHALTPPEAYATTTFVSSSPAVLRPHRFRQAVRERIVRMEAGLVHDHGVWLPTNWASYRAAMEAGVPYVLTTRGMLEPWALDHHAWKKNIVWYAYQHRILKHASLLHATAPAEAENLRALGLEAPIVVAPNGVPLPDEWKQSPSTGSTRTALFLSRVHPKKGLLNLIDAWAEVNPEGWEVVIAGPDEGGHTAEVQARAEQRGIADQVLFPGSIPDADKWALYRASDLFVLPAFSENFGVVVAEALASGIPAITTMGAPWEVLNTHDCGWWVEIGVEPLVDALRDATACSNAERLAMGARGRDLVAERFTWEAVADTLTDAYHWVLDGGNPSSDVLWHSVAQSVTS